MGEYRSVFLKEFTKELILNIDKIDLRKEKTENIENFNEVSERIRKKILEQIEKEYEYSQMRNQTIEGFNPPMPKEIIKPLPTINLAKRGNFAASIKPQIIEFPKKSAPQNQPIPQPQPSIRFSSVDEIIEAIKRLFNDSRVVLVECPGTDQFLLVRTTSRVMLTRIKLTEAEIQGVVDKFSKNTKIPIINGLLNATEDNLNMSAIISDIAGSRFLIKKVYTET